MGASVMTEVLRNTAVQIRDRMMGQEKKSLRPRETLGGTLCGWGRIQAGPGASGIFSSARLSMTTLTESERPSPLRLGRVSLSSRSLAPCLSGRVP